MPRVPSYVEAVMNRKAGEKASWDKENERWTIYKETSKRVPGKATPQKLRVTIAVCTALGREDLKDESSASAAPAPEVMQCVCLDYGPSRILKEKLPSGWVKYCGKYSEPIFLDAVRQILPNSYLLHGRQYTLPNHMNIGLRQKSLWEEYEKVGVTPESIRKFGSIQMLVFPDRKVICAPDEEQERLLAELGVSLV